MAHKRITGMVTDMPSAVRHNISETKPIISRDSASRVKCKIKESETNFYFHFRDKASKYARNKNTGKLSKATSSCCLIIIYPLCER